MAESVLAAEAAARPALAAHYEAMRDLHEAKLWHQLTLKLEDVVALPEFVNADGALHTLYHSFMCHFQHQARARARARRVHAPRPPRAPITWYVV